MANGILIENPNGFVKIDETYARFRVIQSGSMSTPGPVYFPAQSIPPIVFIRPSGYGVPFRVGTRYTDRFWAYSGNSNGAPEVSLSYQVISSTGLVAPVAGSFGLNVYGSSGEVLFTSQDLFMNIDTVINYSVVSGAQEFTVPTPEFGSRYIAMVGPNLTRMFTSGSYYYIYGQSFTLLSETRIRLNEIAFTPTYMPMSLGSYSQIGSQCTLISGYI